MWTGPSNMLLFVIYVPRVHLHKPHNTHISPHCLSTWVDVYLWIINSSSPVSTIHRLYQPVIACINPSSPASTWIITWIITFFTGLSFLFLTTCLDHLVLFPSSSLFSQSTPLYFHLYCLLFFSLSMVFPVSIFPVIFFVSFQCISLSSM